MRARILRWPFKEFKRYMGHARKMRRGVAQSFRGLQEFTTKHRVEIQDLVFVAVAVLGAGFLALEYDVFREDDMVLPREQRLELDEILSLGAFLVSGLLIFSWRRIREYKKELLRRLDAEQRAHASARHDSLTGLSNRRRFTERAKEALDKARRQGSQCAVFFIDLDGFKPVNDTYGHAVGDALLVAIADRLRSHVADPADAARLGGDEFAALIEFAEGGDVPALAARRILREIQQPIVIYENSLRVDATVGVAIGPENDQNAEDLIHAADLAMYEGKKAGRGTVRIFEAA